MRALQRGLFALAMIAVLLAQPMGAAPTSAAPALAAPVTVDLPAVADARTQGGSPDVNFGSGFLYVATLNGHLSFVAFDLLALPANAVIEAARLELDAPTLNDGPNNVEVGRVDGAWAEDTLTWATQPAITWGGPLTNVVGPTLATWDVTPLVRSWHSGAGPNHGFALRGDGGEPLSFSSKEAGITPPTLVIRYTTPADEGVRSDLGDAPDSSNHHGQNNTAYVAGGVLGRFPTVWDVPDGQVAGPRHANATGEGILGQYLSREQDADVGNDQDGPNNIIRSAAGAIGDVADNDRGDDGWRNRNIRFFDCQQQTLAVRVSKAPGAARKRMYLNVWFDGNRDGDWADSSACQPPSGGPAQAGYEWIVQDYVIDMTAVPAGGFLDFAVDTERVANSTPGMPHWMRFTLSEARAVQPPGGDYPDGRGPHPGSAQGSFLFGESEDVLQRPPPPGAPGTLELQKRVITGGEPVDNGGIVTYEIRLRHVGGTGPIQARLRDMVELPQHLLPHTNGSGDVMYVEVTSPGGAAPLQADIAYDSSPPGTRQVITWQGTLAPEAEVTLSFDVHVHPLCGALQQTEISAEADFAAKCPGYNASGIEVEPHPTQLDPLDLNDFRDLPLSYTLTNSHAFSVTLGLLQERVGGAQTGATAPFQQTLTLGPGESREVELILGMEAEATDELAAPDVLTIESRLRYCFISDTDQSCPDPTAYPNLSGQGPPITVRVKPHDLGDAPDSSNHAGAAMAAYPGVPAGFPTVFDPATGLPQGPLHAHPRPLHLGQHVSLEAEADIGPDQDPDNNIEPAANQPNRDRFDDGSRLNPPAANCQPSTAEVRVAITPAAWNWFKGQERPAYLNVWADSNRDGDWADGFACAGPAGQQANVVEHIVIDSPIDVAALGPGLHTISVTTGRVAWPAQLAQSPAWLRFTLSERVSNKTLAFQGISYGDGRGHNTPFKLGETEDHLLRPQGGGAPDLAVALDGRIDRGRIVYRIEVANQGTAGADGATLAITPPAGLGSVAPDLLRAPGIPATGVRQANGKISFALPSIQDGTSNTILLGWDLAGPTSAQAAPLAASYVASAQVALAGDSNGANNSASLTLERPRRQIILAARAAGGAAWGQRDSTCRAGVDLAGQAEPNAIIAILIGLVPAGTVTADASGDFSYRLDGLEAGRHHIQAMYNGVVSPRDPASGLATGLRLDVDPSLPIDPLSLGFTDSKGRTYHPQTLGYSFGVTQTGILLRAGETYQVAVDSCVEGQRQSLKYLLEDALLSGLHDDDGDGRYTGSFTYNSPAARAAALAASGELRLDVTSGGTTRSFTSTLDTAAGRVVDAASGQPLTGAAVSALTEAGGLWPAAALGAANPQTTGADGAYGLGAAGGTSRIAASRSAYQPYVSWDLDGASLDRVIGLTPELAGTPDATVYITDSGFQPALLTVRPGALVEWVNLGLSDHTATGAGWDSGALASGARYRARIGQADAYTYADAANELAAGAILVESLAVYLPLVRR
jgi:hypothetical protein